MFGIESWFVEGVGWVGRVFCVGISSYLIKKVGTGQIHRPRDLGGHFGKYI